MEQKADRDRIAEEAVGQTHGSAPPFAATKSDMSQEEAAQQLLASINRHIANAWSVTVAERPSLAPRAWRFRAWAARLVLPLLEGQL